MVTPPITDRHAESSLLRAGDRGASAVEYALLIAGIAAVIIVVVLVLGGRVQNLFQVTCDTVPTPSAC